jgi:hypothetical protein
MRCTGSYSWRRPVLVGAGDIGCDDLAGAEATAKLLDTNLGTIFAVGDLMYPRHRRAVHRLLWSRHKLRTHPASGNCEYLTGRATAYSRLFGTAAGDPNNRDHYNDELGTWHIVGCNSNCETLGAAMRSRLRDAGCKVILRAIPMTCGLANCHALLFGSGGRGNLPPMIAFGRFSCGGCVSLSIAKITITSVLLRTTDDQPDPQRGIRKCAVGTGGNSSHQILSVYSNLPCTGAVTTGNSFLKREGIVWVRAMAW